MIANALNFVTSELDGFLKRSTSTKKSIVKLSNLPMPNGSFTTSKENNLVLTVVNIVNEGSIANQPNIMRYGNNFVKQTPPIYLNVYFLISAQFNEDQYKEGLHWLSLSVAFFQQNPFFTSNQINIPVGIDKLSFELVNLDIDNMSNFWGALGTPYKPSVIYKMRMLKIDNSSVIGIKNIDIKETTVKK